MASSWRAGFFLSHSVDKSGNPAVMNLAQAAAYLQVSKAHLSNVINGKVRGVSPFRSVRIGRRVLIKREWLDQWLESEQKEVSE
jgi:excisionase family DNA binding protein